MLWQQPLPFPRRQRHLSQSICSFDWKMHITKILVTKEKPQINQSGQKMRRKGTKLLYIMNQNLLGRGASQSRNLKLGEENDQGCFGGFQNQKENVYQNQKKHICGYEFTGRVFFFSLQVQYESDKLSRRCLWHGSCFLICPPL